jgi:hypothetical protein
MSAAHPSDCFDAWLNHRALARIRESRAPCRRPVRLHEANNSRLKAAIAFLTKSRKAANPATRWQAFARS